MSTTAAPQLPQLPDFDIPFDETGAVPPSPGAGPGPIGDERDAELRETCATFQEPPYDIDRVALPWRYKIGTTTYTINYVQAGTPGNPVLLLLHGHSSSIHEFDQLYAHLVDRFHVFSLDLPSCGESTPVTLAAVNAHGAGYPAQRRCLLFLRDLVAHFVDRVIVRAGLGPVHIAGGSLGGNIGLWLGCTESPTLAWLDRLTIWSPGCGWRFGHVGRNLALPTAATNARRRRWNEDRFWESAFGSSAPNAGLPPQPWFWYWDCWAQECPPDGTGGRPRCRFLGGGQCDKCSLRIEDFDTDPDQPRLPPDHDYPPMGARKIQFILGAYRGHRRPPFDNRRAVWHWQIAYETIANSFAEPRPQNGGPPRITRIKVPVTFTAGRADNDGNGGLFGPTRDLYVDLYNSGHRSCIARWIDRAGHSIHNERPVTLAEVLATDPRSVASDRIVRAGGSR